MSTPQAQQARRLYDRLAPVYGPVAGRWEKKARLAGLAALAARPGEQILELGCGPGDALVPLATAVGATGQVVGVDISPRMCAAARRRVERAIPGVPVEVLEADATCLPLDASGFDACFVSFTLELFESESRTAVLAECHRVLSPGGRLVVVGLSEEGRETAMRRVYRLAHRRLPRLLDCRPIPVGATLRGAGFKDVSSLVIRRWGLPVEIVRGTGL